MYSQTNETHALKLAGAWLHGKKKVVLTTPLGGGVTCARRDSPKKTVYFETRERAASTKEMEFPLLGLPKSSEWVLVPNFYDRSLLRSALAYECVRRAGQYAPRTRFVETFFSQVSRGMGSHDEHKLMIFNHHVLW